MKDQMGFRVQRNSSENGKAGRLFILFVGLIMFSLLRGVWKQKLKGTYSSSTSVLQEMMPIKIDTYLDGSSHVTGFTSRQLEIARAFQLNVPPESLSLNQAKTLAKKTAGSKRGRPRGALNKPKKAAG